MSIDTLPSFLCRSPLLSGESLASFLVRLSLLNRYQSPHTVISIAQERLAKKDVLTRPTCTETYQVLQQLTKLAAPTLYQATPHIFTGALTLPGDEVMTVKLPNGAMVPLLPAGPLRRHLWLTHRTAYCPACLKKGLYHRLAWVVWAVTTCLEHRCLLVRGCQACQTFLRIEDVVRGRCPQCRFDLTQAVAVDISQDTFGLFAQTTLGTWFGVDLEANIGHDVSQNGVQATWPQWAASMPQQTRSVLYRLVTGIQRALLDLNPEWTFWHEVGVCRPSPADLVDRRAGLLGLTTEMAYLSLVTAFKAVVNWPDGFYALLDAYQRRHGRSVTHNFPQDFGALYRLCLAGYWSSRRFQFVQDAFDHYLVANYPLTESLFFSRRYRTTPQLAGRLPCMPADEAAERLQVTPHILNRLLSLVFLVNYEGAIVRQSRQKPDFICRSEVLALQQRWQPGLPQEDVARILGVPVSILLDLVDAGMLTATGNPNGNCENLTFSQRSVMKLLERLMYGARSIREVGPYARPFESLAQVLPRFGYRAATVIELAKEHLIRFGWERQAGPQFGTLWVSTDDLDFRLEMVSDDRPFLSRLQVAQQMCIPVAVLMEYAQQGFIPFVREKGLGWQFSRIDVAAFTSQYLMIQDAAFLLDNSIYTMRQLMKNGLLKPVSGPSIDGCKRFLFDRADVEQLSLSRK